MKMLKREELRERLIEEGYVPEFGLEKTIDNLLHLKELDNKSAYEMLIEWVETGKIHKFEPIEGIDLAFLRSKLKMKKPAIILAYGMLLYEPKRNALFLRQQFNRINSYLPKI